jgi:hypothetical protein
MIVDLVLLKAEIKDDVFCHSMDMRNCYDLDRGDVVEFEGEKTD